MAGAELLEQGVRRDAGQRIDRAERLVEQEQVAALAPAPRRAATRCASPPESVLGQSRSRASRPTSRRASCPRSRAPRPRRPSNTLSITLAQGSSRASWKTTARCRGTSIAPVTPASSPASPRNSVLFPGSRCDRGARRTRPRRGAGRSLAARHETRTVERHASVERDRWRAGGRRREGRRVREGGRGGDAAHRLACQRRGPVVRAGARSRRRSSPSSGVDGEAHDDDVGLEERLRLV